MTLTRRAGDRANWAANVTSRACDWIWSLSASLLRCTPIRCSVPPISRAITLSDFPRAKRRNGFFAWAQYQAALVGQPG